MAIAQKNEVIVDRQQICLDGEEDGFGAEVVQVDKGS